MNDLDSRPTPPLPPLPAPSACPLEEAHFAQIRAAAVARRAVRSAEGVAKKSGAITLVIGIVALLVTVFSPSWASLVVALGVIVIGVVELRGCGRLRRADALATRILGYNQLAFLALIAGYCVWQMATCSPATKHDAVVSPAFREVLPALPDMQRFVEGLDKWAPLMVYGFYGLVILISAGFQGGMAAYYFSRRKYVLAFHAQTPEWIKRLFLEMGD